MFLSNLVYLVIDQRLIMLDLELKFLGLLHRVGGETEGLGMGRDF
jgi:hypothetical protein